MKSEQFIYHNLVWVLLWNKENKKNSLNESSIFKIDSGETFPFQVVRQSAYFYIFVTSSLAISISLPLCFIKSHCNILEILNMSKKITFVDFEKFVLLHTPTAKKLKRLQIYD